MNADVFDALARRLAIAGSSAGTRREVLRAFGVGLGVGATALGDGSAGAVSAVGAPVGRARVGPAQEQPRSLPTLVEELAFELEYDVAKIAAFVAEEIRYEPYAGALRGPIGTIWAGAGNAVDQAQLLGALLEASQVSVRYVVGAVEPAALREQFDLGLGWGLSPAIDRVITTHLVAAYPDLDPSLLAGTEPEPEPTGAVRADLLAEAAGRVDVMAERLAGALRDAGVALVAGEVTVPEAEAARHVWVQYRSGADWVDVDPSLPSPARSAGGTTPDLLDAMPDDWFHTVTFRVSHDKVVGSSVERVVSLEHTVRSQEVTNGSLALLHLDRNELSTMGFDLGATLEGTTGSYAMILAGTEFFYATEPMSFGGQGGVLDVLDDNAGLPPGEAVAEFLDIEVRSPGAEPIVATRTIFDRVADQRGGGGIDVGDLAAVELATIGEEKRQYLPLASYRGFAVIAGAVPPRYSLLKAPVDTPLNTFSDAIRGTQAARQAIAAAGATSVAAGFIDRPNVVSYTYSPVADAAGALTALQIGADLIVQGSRGEGGSQATPFGILAGVTAIVAEETALDPRVFALVSDAAPVSSLPGRGAATVARIFAEADSLRLGWRVVTKADDLPPYAGAMPDVARALIAGHLERGRVLVLPDDVVTVDGDVALGWWVYDPGTGELFDQTGQGHGETFVGYLVLVRNAVIARAPFLIAAECIAAVANLANDALTGVMGSGVASAAAAAIACA